MPTIKGPIKVKKGEFPKLISEAVGGFKLPFKATGWESEKGMDLIPDEYKKAGAISAKPATVSRKVSRKKRVK